MSKQHSYGLYIVRNSGERETVLEKEKDFERIRRVALRIKQRPGRKLIITRDNKDMSGGASALDGEAYQRWLELNQPDRPDGLAEGSLEELPAGAKCSD